MEGGGNIYRKEREGEKEDFQEGFSGRERRRKREGLGTRVQGGDKRKEAKGGKEEKIL